MTAPDPITAEERAELRRKIEAAIDSDPLAGESIYLSREWCTATTPMTVLRLLDALEVAEQRRDRFDDEAEALGIRAAEAEAALVDLRQRIEALAEEGEQDGRGNSLDLAHRLRALLVAPEAGEEGQG